MSGIGTSRFHFVHSGLQIHPGCESQRWPGLSRLVRPEVRSPDRASAMGPGADSATGAPRSGSRQATSGGLVLVSRGVPRS